MDWRWAAGPQRAYIGRGGDIVSPRAQLVRVRLRGHGRRYETAARSRLASGSGGLERGFQSETISPILNQWRKSSVNYYRYHFHGSPLSLLLQNDAYKFSFFSRTVREWNSSHPIRG